MKRYEFRLEKLLRLREHLEEIQKLETLQQEQVVRQAMQFRDTLLSESNQVRDDLVPTQGVRWKAGEQHERYRYLIRLRQETFIAENELQKKGEELTRRRQLLVERSREKKTLERLEVKNKEAWQYEADSEQQKELDDIAILQKTRRSERGGLILSSLLILVAISMSVFCYMTWVSWMKKGGIPTQILRGPFDHLAEKKVKQDLASYENQQRVNRKKKEEALAMLPVMESSVPTAPDQEGYRNTVQRIIQKEEALRKKEESLDSQENALLVAQEDLKREINRLNNLQKRIGDELDQLKQLEGRRKAEMDADHKGKIAEMTKSVNSMTPKRAADLLFATAFPNPQTNLPAPLPLGMDLEGIELVVTVMNSMSSKDRGEIMDAMVKNSPEKAATIFDRLDNIKTGLEEDRFYNQPTPNPTQPAPNP